MKPKKGLAKAVLKLHKSTLAFPNGRGEYICGLHLPLVGNTHTLVLAYFGYANLKFAHVGVPYLLPPEVV